MKIRIGTRKSELAMAQAVLVKCAIEEKCPGTETEIVPMSTKGDEQLERSLASFGGKGVFTRELELALAEHRIDLAVHSAKDMPMEFTRGLAQGAVLKREDPRDVVVSVNGRSLSDLPAGAVVGTGSLRREIQVKQMNPGVQIRPLRGNVRTRIRKLKSGDYDAIILAAAGLNRLGIGSTMAEIQSQGIIWDEREEVYLEYIPTDLFVPAAGQGIIATEIRKGELQEVMAAIQSEEDAACLEAERTFLEVLGSGCNAPCGAYCKQTKEGIRIRAMYAADGRHPVYRTTEAADREVLADEAKKLAETMILRRVSLVGAGPGDVGLLTVKGLKCVRTADVIVYDNLIAPSILNEARLDAELIYAGKRSSCHYLKQGEINQLLVQKAMEGKYVVRLKGGDPFVFGRGGEEAMELQKQGIPFEIVDGVSSAYSVPAYAGIPVTERNYASSFHVITGHEDAGKGASSFNYRTLAAEKGTLVFLMGLNRLPEITGQLMDGGKDRQTPVAVISCGTTARQKKVVSTLERICESVKKEKIGTPAITVIGDVVSLEKQLTWFGQGPLAGKRILMTGTRSMARKLGAEITEAGGEPVALSLIETVPRDDSSFTEAVRQIKKYNWAVFTSENGVELFFKQLATLHMDARELLHLKFAVIGSGSFRALEAHHIYADFVPSRYTSSVFAREWVPGLNKEDRVLLLRAREAGEDLPQALKESGIFYTDAAVYETRTDMRRKDELNRILGDVDYITVASGSAARALAAMISPDTDLGRKVVSIGPVTTKTCKKLGIPVETEAENDTALGLVQAILGMQ